MTDDREPRPARRVGEPGFLPSGYAAVGQEGPHPDDDYQDGPHDGLSAEYEPDTDPAGLHPGRRDGRGHRRQGRTPHRVLRILALIAVVLLIAVGITVVWAEGQINPGGHRGPDEKVVIPTGASTSTIGSLLSKAGVIHDGTLFALYVRINGDGPLYPGTYYLPRNSSYHSAISALEAGPKIVIDKLVVPEGFTVRQIAAAVEALPGLGLSSQDFITAATNGSIRSPYESSSVNNLEGLLFPATYDVRQGESVTDVIETMVAAFYQEAQSIGLTTAAAAQHETPYQLVTVASIVEREAKLASDRPPVASVLYNRLAIGMPLGADSTQTYYLRLTDPNLVPSATQLNQPSPYNTRLDKGLPPTPIANPGLPSLEAAAHPASTNYLYFVEINPDGQLGYASTSSGFAQLQQECQAAKLC